MLVSCLSFRAPSVFSAYHNYFPCSLQCFCDFLFLRHIVRVTHWPIPARVHQAVFPVLPSPSALLCFRPPAVPCFFCCSLNFLYIIYFELCFCRVSWRPFSDFRLLQKDGAKADLFRSRPVLFLFDSFCWYSNLEGISSLLILFSNVLELFRSGWATFCFLAYGSCSLNLYERNRWLYL